MDFSRLRRELQALAQPGFIGRFDHIDLLEIIATPKGGMTLNVLSVVVFAEGKPDARPDGQGDYLTGRIRVKGFKDWTFGAQRSVRPLTSLDEALEELEATGKWSISGSALATGGLTPEAGVFAPPDGTETVPLNRVLKNNFWAGSHVFRLRDGEKTTFEPFFADRSRLQELSNAIGSALPIALAGLPDILGDIIIQLPVTVVLPRIEAPGGAENAHLSVFWRSDAVPRALTVAGRNRSDRLLTSATFGEGFSQDVDLGLDIHRNETETEIWDSETGILVSATAATSTLKAFTLNFHIAQPEPRVFSLPIGDGVTTSARVAIASIDRRESKTENQRDRWLSRRQDIEEKRLLDANRDFVQYLPKPGSPDERARALAETSAT